jgi:hypothetical protein
MTLYILPLSYIPQWFTNIGVVATGGQITTYLAGTTTPVTTYTDNTGLVANPNPMTLSAAGRPVSASGAPVAFWVPAGTVVKFIATDAAGNQLDVLDNIAGVDDPTVSTGITGTFQMQVTGVTTLPLVNFRYALSGGPAGGFVILSWDDTGALTSNATGFGFSGMLPGLQGLTKVVQSPLLAAEDNSVTGAAASMVIQNQVGGTAVALNINNASGLWTAAGIKRLFSGSFAYVLA